VITRMELPQFSNEFVVVDFFLTFLFFVALRLCVFDYRDESLTRFEKRLKGMELNGGL
jgi:hypothetical protein